MKFIFSIERDKPSIITKDPEARIGQRIMLSKSDCLKVNKLYGCLDLDNFSKAKYISFCNNLAL